MVGGGEHRPSRRRFDDAPGVHRQDAVGNLGDDAEVVGHQHHGTSGLPLETCEEIEQLRLHGHVERRRRLVGDQQVRS
jgi:hypothetical protein